MVSLLSSGKLKKQNHGGAQTKADRAVASSQWKVVGPGTRINIRWKTLSEHHLDLHTCPIHGKGAWQRKPRRSNQGPAMKLEELTFLRTSMIYLQGIDVLTSP